MMLSRVGRGTLFENFFWNNRLIYRKKNNRFKIPHHFNCVCIIMQRQERTANMCQFSVVKNLAKVNLLFPMNAPVQVDLVNTV